MRPAFGETAKITCLQSSGVIQAPLLAVASSEANACRPLPPMKTRILPLFTAALVAGCVSFPEYNSVIEDRIEQHARRTEEVVAEGDAGRLSAAQSREYLKQARDIARGLHEIVVKSHGRALRAATLEHLAKQYEALLASGKPLRSSTAVPLGATFRELRRLQGYRRHLTKDMEFEPRSTTESTSTSDDSSSSDRDSSKCKKHDHDDHCPKDRHR